MAGKSRKTSGHPTRDIADRERERERRDEASTANRAPEGQQETTGRAQEEAQGREKKRQGEPEGREGERRRVEGRGATNLTQV